MKTKWKVILPGAKASFFDATAGGCAGTVRALPVTGDERTPGGSSIPAAIPVPTFCRSPNQTDRPRATAVRLTSREMDVLQLLAHGNTYTQVSERLGVSRNTIASHVKNLYRKLEVHSARAAVWRALDLRLLGESQRPRAVA